MLKFASEYVGVTSMLKFALKFASEYVGVTSMLKFALETALAQKEMSG